MVIKRSSSHVLGGIPEPVTTPSLSIVAIKPFIAQQHSARLMPIEYPSTEVQKLGFDPD